MKLRNKKTGEIGWLYCDHISVPKKMTVFSEDKDLSANHWDYTSLAELNEEWEDYEDPKEYWYIDWVPEIGAYHTRDVDSDYDKRHKEISNYFETKEKAELAVRKLKAWKRLKDKGFRFKGLDSFGNIRFEVDDKYKSTHLNLYPFREYEDDENEYLDDLYLLFGGEE